MKKYVLLCSEKDLLVIQLQEKMAKPIAPTPPLKGQAAVDFVEEINKNKKASATEKSSVKEGASRIKAMLTFTF